MGNEKKLVESQGASANRGALFQSASAQTARSIKTGIRADVGESEAYKAALARGEIGLQRPLGANVAGADFITAVRQTDGSIRIFITDVKTSTVGRFPRPEGAGVPAAWMAELRAAVAPDRLNLGDPALEEAIRHAVNTAQVRQVNVDYSPRGMGRVYFPGDPVPQTRTERTRIPAPPIRMRVATEPEPPVKQRIATEPEIKQRIATEEPQVKQRIATESELEFENPEAALIEADKRLRAYMKLPPAARASERGFVTVGNSLFMLVAVGATVYVLSEKDKFERVGQALSEMVGQLAIQHLAARATGIAVVGGIAGMAATLLEDDRSPEGRREFREQEQKVAMVQEFMRKRVPGSVKEGRRFFGLFKDEEFDIKVYKDVYRLLFETEPVRFRVRSAAPPKAVPAPASTPAPAPPYWRTEYPLPPSTKGKTMRRNKQTSYAVPPTIDPAAAGAAQSAMTAERTAFHAQRAAQSAMLQAQTVALNAAQAALQIQQVRPPVLPPHAPSPHPAHPVAQTLPPATPPPPPVMSPQVFGLSGLPPFVPPPPPPQTPLPQSLAVPSALVPAPAPQPQCISYVGGPQPWVMPTPCN